MEKQNVNVAPAYSQKFLRKRKMLTIMPLFVVFFLTLGFYALGGGRGNQASQKDLATKGGLNLQLPNSNLKENKKADKLSFYEKAEEDSQKLREQMKMDPYYDLKQIKDQREDSLGELENITRSTASRYNQQSVTGYKGLNPSPTNGNGSTDPAADKIMKKIAQLNEVINQPQPSVKGTSENTVVNTGSDSKEKFSSDVDRLQNMMEAIGKPGEDDPEMKRLEGVLDKIITVQHPEQLSEKLKEKSIKNKDQAFVVSKSESELVVSLLQRNAIDTNGKKLKVAESSGTGFFSLDETNQTANEQTGIAAAIQETSTLTSGSTVKFRLLDDIYVGGMLVPKGIFVSGIASLNDERLKVNITTIEYNNSILPVKLSVYDLDGMEGIYIPGSIGRDVAKQTAQNAVQGMDVLTLDPSITAQATAAGIGAAKSLITRKAKLVKVTIKANYRVLLRDMNTQQ